MRKRLLRLTCLGSVTLLVAILLAAPLSWRYLVLAEWTAASRRINWTARIVFGDLEFTHLRLDPPEDQLIPCESGFSVRVRKVSEDDSAMFSSGAVRFRFAGVAYYALYSGGLAQYDLMVPLWIPALLLSTAPSLSLYRWRRARSRRAARLCLRCGYDLRASTGRCPECGTPITVRMDA